MNLPHILLLYIDPGLGSMISSVIIGLTLTLMFTMRNLFYKVVSIFWGKFKSYDCNFEGQLVFFNEGKNYWKVFKPVLDSLIAQRQHCVYISADKDDPGIKLQSEYVQTICLGSMRSAIFSLNRLKAKMCIMTTPQLDVLQLKCSKYVKHYCHLLHAPVDIHVYKKFAFDEYDSVLCSSTFQINHIRYLEKKRGTKAKTLLETGCTYYDEYVSPLPVNSLILNNAQQAVLIAPTWGDKSSLSIIALLIERVLLLGYAVIFRPHPQSWISDKALIEHIIKAYESNISFSVDKDVDMYTSMHKATLMICDVSGIIYDFALLFKKPIITLVGENNFYGYEGDDIPERNSALYLVDEVGAVLPYKDTSDIVNIDTAIEQAIYTDISTDIIDMHIFNFKSAGEVAATQIKEIYNTL